MVRDPNDIPSPLTQQTAKPYSAINKVNICTEVNPLVYLTTKIPQ